MKGYFARKPETMEDLERARGWGVKDGQFLCILVRKVGTKHTAIAVESDGYDYARYAALVRI